MSIMPFMKMLGTVVKHLIIGSPCKMYPVQSEKTYETTRAKIEIDNTTCICCSLCAKKCPTGALSVDRDKRIWTINRFKCILCGLCVECCPKKSLTMSSERPAPAEEKSEESVSIETPERPAKAKPSEKE